VGLHAPLPTVGSRSVDRQYRRLLRQRRHRVILGRMQPNCLNRKRWNPLTIAQRSRYLSRARSISSS
jgi:hypothetical protein